MLVGSLFRSHNSLLGANRPLPRRPMNRAQRILYVKAVHDPNSMRATPANQAVVALLLCGLLGPPAAHSIEQLATYEPPREAVGRITREELRELVESEGRDVEPEQPSSSSSKALRIPTPSAPSVTITLPVLFSESNKGAGPTGAVVALTAEQIQQLQQLQQQLISQQSTARMPRERTEDLLLLFLLAVGLIGSAVFFGVPFLQQLQSKNRLSMNGRRRDGTSFPSYHDPLLDEADDDYSIENTEKSLNALLRKDRASSASNPPSTSAPSSRPMPRRPAQQQQPNSNNNTATASPRPQQHTQKKKSPAGASASPQQQTGGNASSTRDRSPSPAQQQQQQQQQRQQTPSPTPSLFSDPPAKLRVALVADTNAFIKDLKSISAIREFFPHAMLALPGVVVSELEGLQQSPLPEVAFQARVALRFLRTELSTTQSPSQAASGWIRTAALEAFTPPTDMNDRNGVGAKSPSQLRLADLEVLSFALRVHREFGTRTKTVLLTSDKGLQVRALMTDIEAQAPTEFVKNFTQQNPQLQQQQNQQQKRRTKWVRRGAGPQGQNSKDQSPSGAATNSKLQGPGAASSTTPAAPSLPPPVPSPVNSVTDSGESDGDVA